MTERHMKTLFVLHRPRLGEIERLQEVLGPDFVVVQVGQALGGRRDLKAAIVTRATAQQYANPQYRAMLEGYINIDVTLRLNGAPMIHL